MKTLLHPPLLESWVLNTLAVKPQETKHGPTCCLSESHDKLENLALCGLTPSSTCNESSFERISKSQSSFFFTQCGKARKWLTCLICELLCCINQGWSSNRCLKQGPSLGESRQAVTGGEPRLSTPARRKCPLQHWWWNWTAVPSNPGLSEQAAFNVLGKLPSPVCLFLDQKASQLQPLYSTQQFFAKCCQSQRLNDKNGEIWWNDVKSIQGLETTCLKISQNVARFLKPISESFRSSLLRHHSPPRAPVECRMSTHRMQEYNEQSSRWWSYLASRRAAM